MGTDLSIIVPIYNEEETLVLLLNKLFASLKKTNLHYQVIAIDDGSSDRSAKLLQEYKSNIETTEFFDVIFHNKNQGKGAAIHSGLLKAVGEYTIIQDADLEYEPNDIIKLYTHAKKEKLPALYGSRNKGTNKQGPFFFYWGGKLITYIANFLFGQKMTDEATCYKLIETKRLKSMPLSEKGFAFCPEVTSYLAKDGVKIQELAISYNPRSKNDGKKINWRDGIEAVHTLLRLKYPQLALHSYAFLLFVFTIFLYLTTWHMSFQGYEGETANSALRLFEGEYDVRRAGIAASLLYLPFIAFIRLCGAEMYTNLLTVVPIFYSALSIVFLFYITWYVTQKKYISLIVTFLIATGTTIWPYTNIGMEYQMTFFLTMLLLVLLRWRKNGGSLLSIGIVFALLAAAKTYALVIGLPIWLFILLVRKNQKQKNITKYLKDFLIVFLPTCMTIISIFLIQYNVHGSLFGVYSLNHEFQIWTWWEGLYGIFFSIGKSIILFSPLLIVSLFGWNKFWKEHKETSIFIITSFVLLLLITAPFSYWTDETWSVRKLVPIIALLHLPLVYVFEKKYTHVLKKILLFVIISISIYIQILGASYFYGKQLDILREANLDTLQNMRFIPQLGHKQLHNKLLLNYLSNQEAQLVYNETTWFRWIRNESDVIIHATKLDISRYQTPDIIWLQDNTYFKKVIFYVLLLGVSLSGWIILRQFFLLKKKEE